MLAGVELDAVDLDLAMVPPGVRRCRIPSPSHPYDPSKSTSLSTPTPTLPPSRPGTDSAHDGHPGPPPHAVQIQRGIPPPFPPGFLVDAVQIQRNQEPLVSTTPVGSRYRFSAPHPPALPRQAGKGASRPLSSRLQPGAALRLLELHPFRGAWDGYNRVNGSLTPAQSPVRCSLALRSACGLRRRH